MLGPDQGKGGSFAQSPPPAFPPPGTWTCVAVCGSIRRVLALDDMQNGCNTGWRSLFAAVTRVGMAFPLPFRLVALTGQTLPAPLS